MVKETLNALEALAGEDNSLVFFDSQSHHQGNGNFQIVSANESDDNLSVNLGAFYFVGTKNSTRVLFFEFNNCESKIFKGTESILLSKEIYSHVHNQITNKLGENISSNIHKIEI